MIDWESQGILFRKTVGTLMIYAVYKIALAHGRMVKCSGHLEDGTEIDQCDDLKHCMVKMCVICEHLNNGSLVCCST